MSRARHIVLVLFLAAFPGIATAADQIAAVMGVRVEPYMEALRGFRSACDRPVKEIVLDEQEARDPGPAVRAARPVLVLAIGREALLKTLPPRGIPIVYLMVMNPAGIVAQGGDVTGVSMYLPPAEVLDAVHRLLPRASRIGALYDPAKTGYLVDGARAAARDLGLEIIAREIRDSRQVPPSLAALRGKIDILWMLPDTTVLTPDTLESLLLFSLEAGVPMVSFAARYAELGALMSLETNPRDVGRQAGEMAANILGGAPARSIPPAHPRSALMTVNLGTARMLSLDLDKDTLDKAKIIQGR